MQNQRAIVENNSVPLRTSFHRTQAFYITLQYAKTMDYFIIEIILASLTAALHRVFRLHLFQTTKQMFWFWTIVVFFGIFWDAYAIYSGHWQYSDAALIGLRVLNVPLEDFLFVFVVPYFVLVIYSLSATIFFRKPSNSRR